MVNFIFGVIVGVAISTVGITELAKMGDKALDQTRTIIKQLAE